MTNDPLLEAKASFDRGDVDGAERTLAAALLDRGTFAGDSAQRDRLLRALVRICEQRRDVGMRAQQALEAFLAQPAQRDGDEALALRIHRLFADAGVSSGVLLSAALPDLPDLDGFSPVTNEATIKQAKPRSLADVRNELELEGISVSSSSGVFTVNAPAPDTIRDVVLPAVASPTPAVTPAAPGHADAKGVTKEIGAAFNIGAIVKERYEVRGALGRGGHATVVRVFDRELDEECALKIFHHSGDAVDVARFKREVSLSRKVVHPNVISLYDIGQEAGFYFLTMELLEGKDLSSVLRERGVQFDESIGWLVASCNGLQAAHDKGIVHRDVKPANLFIQRSGPLKVMDFGIAKPADSVSLTSTGVFVGTPQFVSPEQVKGEDVGPAADVYSLGVVAYLLVTGTLPFRDKEMVALLMKHATARPDPPRSRNPDVSPALDRLILGCLEKSPSARPASCNEVARTLEQLRAD